MGNRMCPVLNTADENQSSSQGNTSALLTGNCVRYCNNSALHISLPDSSHNDLASPIRKDILTR